MLQKIFVFVVVCVFVFTILGDCEEAAEVQKQDDGVCYKVKK